MENNERKIKFPISSIFMILSAVLRIYMSVTDKYSDTVDLVIIGLLFSAIAILAIKKMNGLPILIPATMLLMNGLLSLYFQSALIVIIWKITFVLALVCIVLLCLDDMRVESVSKISRIVKIAFIVVALLHICSLIVWFFCYNVRTIYAIGYVCDAISILLIGLWIINPYAKVKTFKPTDTSATNYISLGKHICLMLFTGGIWLMIWIYKTTIFTNCATDEEWQNPTTKLLLCLFVPFYSIFWTYKAAQRIDKIAKERAVNSDLGTICLILSIFVPIIPPILMQDKINEISKASF